MSGALMAGVRMLPLPLAMNLCGLSLYFLPKFSISKSCYLKNNIEET